ncbi:MAG TPA: 6,7-dimethyl-8-ribityllumazine synthase [Candidatus Thermoplasmatota archaeon]|nr:6,7-dimethyl-8-ribityllumazine synthase [Candidatus Thermoplasmatota archaeon]
MPGRSVKKKIAIAWGEFNDDITGEMRERAARRIREAGYEPAPVVAVSGTYDLPFAVDRALAQRGVVAAVAIGCVITGETRHDELIAHAAAKSLLDISLARGKPVGLGVTGPGQTRAQAEARVDRAEAAVDAVLKLLGEAPAAAPKRH